MSNSPIFIHEISQYICDWATENRVTSGFHRAYIFGSLINRDGRHFIAEGSSASDVDFLLVFDASISTAFERSQALISLRKSIKTLEHGAAQILKRVAKESIFSILPITQYELHQNIHKGADPKLLSANIFWDVFANSKNDGGLSAGLVDYDYHFENLEAFSAIRLCQAYRNKYLKCNLIGEFSQGEFDGETTYPKELMRGAALLRFFERPAEVEFRTDLEEGSKYLTRLVEQLDVANASAVKLRDKVSGRDFQRAQHEPLAADDLLLLNEILFDRARELIIPSVRDAIQEIMARGK